MAQNSNVEKVFHLDETTARPGYVKEGVFKLKGNQVYYLNTLTNQIKVFDFQSGKIVNTISLEKEGPNAVGPMPYTFHLIDKDSILVYSDFTDHTMFLINSSGRVLDKISMSKTGDPEADLPGLISDGNNAIVVRNRVIYAAKILREYSLLEKFSPVIQHSMSSDKSTTFNGPLQYPGEMLKRVPMIDQVLAPNLVYNSIEDVMVLSYPLDDHLYVSEDGFKTYKKVRATSKAGRQITLLKESYEKLSYPKFREQGIETMRLSVQYLNLIYDEYRNCYYRVVRVPHDKKKYSDFKKGVLAKLGAPEYSVMTLDAQFRVKSEVNFTLQEFRIDMGVFVSPEGIWLLRPQLENEDEMIFELLSKTEKNEN